MSVLRVFFLGLVYGWFMRWIIDEIFVKDHLRMITNENARLHDRIRALEAPKSLDTLSIQRTEAAAQPAERPAAAAAPARARSANEKDDLKLIKGIGPKLEKKLNSAGVTTFDQMSRLTAAELQAILGISKRVVQNTDNLISQAKKFAQERSEG